MDSLASMGNSLAFLKAAIKIRASSSRVIRSKAVTRNKAAIKIRASSSRVIPSRAATPSSGAASNSPGDRKPAETSDRGGRESDCEPLGPN